MRILYFCLLSAIFVSGASTQTATVQATLLDARGNPISGAVVAGEATRRGVRGGISMTSLRATSDSKGVIRISDAPTEPSLDLPIVLLARLPNGHFSRVSISGPDQQITLVDEPVNLRVHVSDERGRPVSGTRVSLERIYAYGPSRGRLSYRGYGQPLENQFVAMTNNRGDVVLTGLPRGESVYYSTAKVGMVGLGNGVRLEQSGETSSSAVLERSVTLSGRVLANGKPVPGVYVIGTIQRPNLGTSCSAITGIDGTYRIEGAFSGTIKLRIELGALKENWTTKTIHEIQLNPGDSREGLNFVMENGILISGRVVGIESGKPIPHANLRIDPRHGNSSVRTTDEQGRFTSRVLPGYVEVVVTEVHGKRVPSGTGILVFIDAKHNQPLEIRVPDSALKIPVK